MSIMFSGGPIDGQEAPDPDAPVEPEPSTDQPEEGGGPVEILRSILLQFRDYMDAEQDEEDIAVASDCLARIQKLLAKNQKEQESLVGSSPAIKAMAKRATAGGGY